MTVFDSKTCEKEPRADMFLPDRIRFFGLFLDVAAVAAVVATFIVGEWWLLLVGLALACGGFLTHLCWKNQTIRILDQSSFEHSTFLGKKTRYYFSDIKRLRENQDSFTLFVGDRKVHIEACVCISQTLLDKMNDALTCAEKKNDEV